MNYTVCGADDRRMNRKEFTDSFQWDYIDDGNFFGVAQDKNGVIDTDVVAMIKRVATNGAARGGWRLAPDKTDVRVNVVTEHVMTIKKMLEEVVVGGKVKLVRHQPQGP